MDPLLIVGQLTSKVQDHIDTTCAGRTHAFQLRSGQAILRLILQSRGRDPEGFTLKLGDPCYDGRYTARVEPRSAIDRLADLA